MGESPPNTAENYNPEQTPLPEKRILLAQAGPAQRRAAIQESTDILTKEEVKKKLESLPGMTEEKIFEAERAIRGGLFSFIKNHAQLTKYFRIKGFNDKAYYMPLAVKESSLKPELVSRSNAVGYFQIKQNAFDDVKAKFPGEINFNFEDIHFDPNTPANAKLDERKRQVHGRIASEKNARVGILFWHLTKDKYLGSITKAPTLELGDAEKFTCFGYKIGSGATKTLYEMTGKPKTFREFAIKLAGKLEKESGGVLTTPKNKSVDVLDPTYNLGYRAYLEQNYTDQLKKKLSGKTFNYGGRTFNVQNLFESLRYAEVVKSLMFKAPKPTGKLKDLSGPKPQAPKPKPAPKPTQEEPPKYTDKKLSEIAAANGFDTIKDGNWLWSVAETLLTKCETKYRIPYFLDESKTKTVKIRLLINLMVAYNKEVLDREEFDDADPEDEDPNINKGTTIIFPPKQYIIKALKKANEYVAPKKLEVLPKNIPEYCGPDADKLEKEGEKTLTHTGKSPKVVIPSYKKKQIDIDKPGRNGKMKKDDVEYIILHSTEGDPSSLHRNQGIHYLLRKDGVIELIRNEDIAIDHAGVWANQRQPRFRKGKFRKWTKASMAYWNGDKNISLHSIGIEVETSTGEEYNEKQYKALKQLVEWIGARYKIKKKNVLGHSQIATLDMIQYSPEFKKKKPKNMKDFYTRAKKVSTYNRFGRGRKQDPRNLKWDKLGLPNNYFRVDPDVAAGTIQSHLKRIKREMNGIDRGGWNDNTSPQMLEGLEYADQYHKSKSKKKP